MDELTDFCEPLLKHDLCWWVVGHACETGTHRLWWNPELLLPCWSSLTPHLCNSSNHLLLHHHRFIMVLEGSCLLRCLHQIV